MSYISEDKILYAEVVRMIMNDIPELSEKHYEALNRLVEESLMRLQKKDSMLSSDYNKKHLKIFKILKIDLRDRSTWPEKGVSGEFILEKAASES